MNNVTLLLEHFQNHKWFTDQKISAKGDLFAHGSLYQDKELCNYFLDIRSEKEFVKKVRQVNGQFSVIFEDENRLLVAVDRLRSFPLFYTLYNGELYLTDEVDSLRPYRPFNLSPQQEQEFAHLGYTLGHNTLIKEVYQLQAGEYLVFENGTVRTAFYHSHLDGVEVERSLSEWKSQLKQIINNVAQRLVKKLNGRPVAIPLSGGYDSRLIAYMLYKQNYTNVLCFTYGKPTENEELKHSQQIAKTLGYQWLFVDYIKFADTNYITDPLFLSYCKYVTQYSSCYFYQEFPAIRYLITEQMIDPNTVFLPGHSGDVMAGSHLRSFMKSRTSKIQIAKDLFNAYFKNKDFTLAERKGLIGRLCEQLKQNHVPTSYRDLQNWDLKERQAKYIVNSSKIWEFFGFSYSLPLWDNELVDFFATMPFDYRLGKRVYDEVLQELFAEEGISFLDDFKLIDVMSPRIEWFKNEVKNYLPLVRKRRYLWDFDSVGFEHMMQGLMKELKDKGLDTPLRSYNGATFAWYLSHIKPL